MSLFESSGARFDESRAHRFDLWRTWDASRGYVAWVCLNPSTADESANDPTVTRCCNYAARWGYGGMHMLNIFSYRSTDPENLYTADRPEGDPENMATILRVCSGAALVVGGWGSHGAYRSRGDVVRATLSRRNVQINCLTITLAKQPGHPLYLRKDIVPKPL